LLVVKKSVPAELTVVEFEDSTRVFPRSGTYDPSTSSPPAVIVIAASPFIVRIPVVVRFRDANASMVRMPEHDKLRDDRHVRLSGPEQFRARTASALMVSAPVQFRLRAALALIVNSPLLVIVIAAPLRILRAVPEVMFTISVLSTSVLTPPVSVATPAADIVTAPTELIEADTLALTRKFAEIIVLQYRSPDTI